jgi:hypothetical protein
MLELAVSYEREDLRCKRGGVSVVMSASQAEAPPVCRADSDPGAGVHLPSADSISSRESGLRTLYYRVQM